MNIFDLAGSTRALLAAAIALVPALVSYVRGRQIAKCADSPALPEQLFAERGITTKVLAFAISMLLMLTGSAAIWAIPLTIIAYAAAGLPLRKILYEETWSLAVYLSFVVRFFAAGWGFWMLVSALPALAFWWSAETAWIVALLGGAGLMLLAERQTEWIRWLIGSKPIVDETMRGRFDRLVSAATLAVPHFEFVDLKGGSFANAFALASLGRGAVVFTGPLLERLDADETDAICAHELAHLEYYNPRRLRRQRLVSRALVIGGATLSAFLYLIPSFAWLACAAWPSVVLISIAVLVHDRQKHETASDLRAVALTGNPEALVRGLTKLHAIARVPRRWDADLERHMSHPSPKRRIQDIRAAAGIAPALLGDSSVFESSNGAARAIFGNECLEWIEGASASYRLRYERLGELRVDATRAGEPRLLVAVRAGHRWHMPLRLDDVPRLQAVLDIIDARVETSAAEGIQPMLVRVAAFTVFIVSLNAGLIGMSVVLAMALARPDAPLLCAAGVAAMAGALVRWRDQGSMYGFIPGEYDVMFGVALFAGGALLLWLAYVRRRDEVTPRGWKLIGALAGVALASWVFPIMGRGVDAVGLHLAVRDWPASVMLPLALAAAMMWSARKALRIASVGAVAVSVVGAWIGSQAFLDRFGDDLFLKPAPEAQVRTLDRPMKEFTLPFTVSRVQLSPGGASIAAITRRSNGGTTVHIGRAGQTLTPIDADDALFIDDDRALVWTVDGSRADLREVLVSSPHEAGWQLRVTGLSTPVVTLDRPSRRWRLMNPAGVNVLEAREGVVGTEQIATHRWDVPQRHGSPFMPIAMADGRTLAIEPRPDLSSSLTDYFGALAFVLAGTPHWRSTLWAFGADGASDLGTSRLELQCHLLPLGESGLCHVFDSSRTRFFSVNARTSVITAVATLPGRLYVGDEPQGSWIAGWSPSGPVGLRLAPADAIRIVDAQGADAHMLALSDRVAAGIWHQYPAASTLRVEPVYERTGTSLIRIYSIE